MRQSLELANRYTIIRSSDRSLVLDQFGFFDKEVPAPFKIKRPPIKDNTSLIDVCKERAVQLGEIKLAWSGGVDSTFLLAVFKSLGINIVPVYFSDIGREALPELISYVKDNFDLLVVPFDEWLARGEKIYTGAGADVLFNSEALPPRSELIVQYSNGNRITIRKQIEVFDVTYDKQLVEYGEYLGVPIVTNLDALRVLTIGCKFWHNAYNYGNPMKSLGANQESFFDTERFMDIAFTQYFDRQCLINPPKTEEKDFIKSVFGSDFNVVKN